MNGPEPQAKPAVSVITVTLNAERGVQATIDSVLGQTQAAVELVVVDGCSSDGTQAIVRKYGNRIAQFVSERDRGIYDAMNKGARLAHGEWVLFLNAGDTLASVDSLKQLVGESAEADVVYGDCLFIRQDGSTRYYKAKPAESLWARMACPHPSTMVRRRLLLEHPFDLQYRIAADHDFLLGCWVSGCRFQRVNGVISTFQMDGFSTKRRFESIKEARRASITRAPKRYTTIVYGGRIMFSALMLGFERLAPTAILQWIGRRQLRDQKRA